MTKLMYEVIRDTREKEGKGWIFEKGNRFSGTIFKSLDTGDYTLRNFEKIVRIERKGTITEFANNLVAVRFEKALVRLVAYPVAVVMLEFTYNDLMTWPKSSPIGYIPGKKIQISREALQKIFWKLQLKYPSIHFQFVGRYGHEAASCLFKRVVEQYDEKA